MLIQFHICGGCFYIQSTRIYTPNRGFDKKQSRFCHGFVFRYPQDVFFFLLIISTLPTWGILTFVFCHFVAIFGTFF